jgi:hypothetical protein
VLDDNIIYNIIIYMQHVKPIKKYQHIKEQQAHKKSGCPMCGKCRLLITPMFGQIYACEYRASI